MNDFEVPLGEGSIGEFSVKPKPQNNKAKILLIVLCGITLALFVTYFIIPNYKGVVGLVAVAAMTAAITVYTKYISASFCYDVLKADDGTALFVVRQIVGKKEQTLCRIELAYIDKVEFETKAERKAKKPTTGYSTYVFFPSLDPETSCRMRYTSRYEKSEVLVELPREYCELLASYARTARLQNLEADE